MATSALNLQSPANDDDSGATALEAAQALLAAVLSDNDLFREAGHIKGTHFYEPVHGRIWEVVRTLIDEGKTALPVSVADQMAADPGLISLGGAQYLWLLWDRLAGSARLVREHAEAVLDAFTRRAASALLGDAAKALVTAASPRTPALLGELRQRLTLLEQSACADREGLQTAPAASIALVDALEEEAQHGRPRGAMTGLRCFDRRLRGLRPGWLIVIGGRPSMGKTSLMRAAAYGCAERNPGRAVLVHSLEMDARELAERALSAATLTAGDGIAYADFSEGLTASARATLAQVGGREPPNLHIDDRPAVSLDDIHRRVWALKAERAVAAVFIDYLQLMTRPSAHGRTEALVLGEVTQGLKRLAREADTCVVLLSQLNRQVESRDDKRPQLADLRDSGSIEQDANAVLFPYRAAYYLERNPPRDDASSQERERWQMDLEGNRRRMDVIAAKVRGGAIGTDRQAYFAEFDHVEDLAQ